MVGKEFVGNVSTRLGEAARLTGTWDIAEPAHTWAVQHRWHWLGRPLPPPSAVKRSTLRLYADRYGIKTLVETGTYKADTVRALRRLFARIYSIEVDPVLYGRATRRCRRQGNAVLLLGDSAELLSEVVAQLMEPSLFWLDAHYSGGETGMAGIETPVLAELEAILQVPSRGHVVLVDDYREFVRGQADYPSERAVRELAESSGYAMSAADDILRLVPLRAEEPVRW